MYLLDNCIVTLVETNMPRERGKSKTIINIFPFLKKEKNSHDLEMINVLNKETFNIRSIVDIEKGMLDNILNDIKEENGNNAFMEFITNIVNTKKSDNISMYNFINYHLNKSENTIEDHIEWSKENYTPESVIKWFLKDNFSLNRVIKNYDINEDYELSLSIDSVNYWSDNSSIMIYEKKLIDKEFKNMIDNINNNSVILNDWMKELIEADVVNRYKRIPNYKSFDIPKKNGEYRKIYDPEDNISEACTKLNYILHHIMEKRIEKNNTDNIIAYRIDKNIKNNAIPHDKSDIVFKMDIENYFPSCKMHYYDNLFKHIFKITEKNYFGDNVDNVKLKHEAINSAYDSVRPYLKRTLFGDNNGLFIGNVVSGTLSNILMIPFVRYINNILKKKYYNKVKFTMYADDMTFSVKRKDNKELKVSMRYLEFIVRKALNDLNYRSFKIKDSKSKIQSDQRRRITGLRINHRNEVTIDRHQYTKLRSMLYKIEKGKMKPEDIEDDTPLSYLGKINYFVYNDTTGKFKKILSMYSKAFEDIKEAAKDPRLNY